MEDNKKLEKIQKCLRMSKSANANEASIALRMAQKMMQEMGIDENGLEKMGYGSDTADYNVLATKTAPIQLIRLVNLVKLAFGVEAYIETKRCANCVGYRIRYFGLKSRLPTACYAQQVLFRAMEGAWSLHLSLNPQLKGKRGYRSSFQTGWLAEVKEKVVAIGFTEQEEQILQDLVAQQYPNGTNIIKKKNMIFSDVNQAGKDAAKNFQIHRPMDGKTQLAIGG